MTKSSARRSWATAGRKAALLPSSHAYDGRTAGPTLAIRKAGRPAAVASFSLRPPSPLDPSIDLDDAIGAAWPPQCGLEALRIAVFEHLAADAGIASALVWRSVRSLMAHLLAPEADVLLLKAFPLEWDGRPEGFSTWSGSVDFATRQAAMVLRYARMLGARPILPAACGGVWMWVPMRPGISAPSFKCSDVRTFSRELVAHAIDPHGLSHAGRGSRL